MSKVDLTEETKDATHVETLVAPVPVMDGGTVIGTASLIKEDVLDYKTKQPTGEKLIHALFTPAAGGRNVKVRWRYASAMVEAINGALTSGEDDDADEGETGDE